MAGGRALVKLFGKTIPLAPPPGSKDFPVPVDDGGGGGTENGEEEIGEGLFARFHLFDDAMKSTELQELADRAAERGDDGSGTEGEMRNGEEGSEAPLGKKGLKAAEEEEDGDGTKGPPEPEKTTLPAKKPEKIIPCPRCSSMATKFCYYNNYNVNQPRHFCKNCQRYWTAGGSMRNVPVGAGRRKSKHGAAAAATAQPTVLRFGPDDPLRDTESLAEKKPPPPATAAVSCSPNSSGFSTEDRCASNLQNKPILRSPPSFTWSAPGAMKFYPTAGAFWGWASPWPAAPPPVKRFREETLRHSTREENSSCRLWIPKTLRIDHPEEAVKSSIWAMAGGIFDRARKEGMGSSAALPHANPAALSRSLSFRESA